jgi:hypothetical protein
VNSGLATAPALLRARQSDEGRRFIETAQAMGVQDVSKFGDKIPEGEPRDDVTKLVVEVPVEEQVRVLAASGYAGFYGFEWEKMRHPEIEEPNVAFPHCAKTMAGYVFASGVKPS